MLCVVLYSLVGASGFAHAAGFPTAASSPATHVVINGYDDAATNGDYVTSTLRGYYSFRIEVPPGTTSLAVDIWDADICMGADERPASGDPGARDEWGGSARESEFYYSLYTPGGSLYNYNYSALNRDGTFDNVWRRFWDIASPAAGHWELRVQSINTLSTDNDYNAFAVRASAAGRDLNIYVDGIAPFGTNRLAATDYDFYPYVVSGCGCSSNDFDSDADPLSYGYSLATRTGTTSWGPFTPAANGTWASASASGFTTANDATDYGVWSGSKSKPPDVANIYNYYVGAWNSTGPNPVTNAVRLYAPTDAGAAPVKPYFEQVTRYKSGMNPPASGFATTMRVTAYVVNPTPYAITFSLTNLVRTAVPATRTTYGGNASATQGTIVSQPAVGGTGKITWNPGTVAAGATVALAYDVVVTPTANGQLTYVTPLPNAAVPTTATFVDETGSTTQARATMTLGPLCQLSITSGTMPTLAVVASFSARTGADGTKVEWTTSAADGTAGFVLERQRSGEAGFTPVHEGILAGPVGVPVGARWEYVDRDVAKGQVATYRLVEVEANGNRRPFGPWANEPADSAAPRSGDVPQFVVTPHPRDERATPASGEPASPQARRTEPVGKAGLKIETEGSGLYVVPVDAIAPALGLTQPRATELVRAGRLELTNRGRAVAWTATKAGDGVVFWAEALEDAYAPRNAWFLREGRGETMPTASPASADGPEPMKTAPEILHLERERVAATLFPVDPDGDYWYWETLQANHPKEARKSLSLDVPGVAGGPARLTVNLAGGSTTKRAGEHHVRATLNGVPAGEVRFEGTGVARLVAELPAGSLHDGENVLELTALLSPGVSNSTVMVDSVDVAYERRTEARGSAHVVQPARSGLLEVTGLAEGELFALDVSDPARPAIVPAARAAEAADGAARLGVEAGRRYAVATRAGLRRPAAIGPDRSGEIAEGVSAEWVVVTTSTLAPAVKQLEEYRATQGITTRIVDVEAVYDAYGDGLRTPKALRAFFARLAAEERTRPRWVLLAGAGDFDFKGNNGLGGNELPPLMISTPAGLLASDNALVDFDGNGAPDLTIGRLPVRTHEELAAYVEKVRAHERRAAPGQTERVLLLADDPDGGMDFAADAQALLPAFPSGWVPETHTVGSAPLRAVRAGLLSSWTSGAGAIAYYGHGGFDRLASEGLLTSADVPSLSTPTYPVLTGLSCFIGRFDIPGHTSLGHRLVVTEGKGSAAVWAGAGWSNPVEARSLGREFGRIAFTNRAATLGDAVHGSLDAYRARGGTAETMLSYVLLGDPALRLRAPAGRLEVAQEGSR
jgi:hypothetical protein